MWCKIGYIPILLSLEHVVAESSANNLIEMLMQALMN
jgi:hypothetical protein